MDAVHPKYLEARAAETYADALSMEAASARHVAVTASIASGELLLPLQRADPRDVQFWRDFGAPRGVVAVVIRPGQSTRLLLDTAASYPEYTNTRDNSIAKAMTVRPKSSFTARVDALGESYGPERRSPPSVNDSRYELACYLR